MISVVFSYVVILEVFRFFDAGQGMWMVLFPLFLFGYLFLVKKIRNIQDKTCRICSGIFSVALSFSFVVGNKIQMWEEPYFTYLKWEDVEYFLALIFFFYVIGVYLFAYFKEKSLEEGSYRRISWYVIWGIIVICWLPYFLAHYPGNLSIDSFATIDQCLGKAEYSNHHPILFTMFVNLFVDMGTRLGDINLGIAAFSFSQMLIMAGVLCYCVCWMQKKHVSQKIVWGTTLFFALNPVIAMYSITMWKDILFGAWMLLFLLCLYDCVESDGEFFFHVKGILRFSICAVLVSFWRNNGFYVVIAVAVVLAVYYRTYYKRILPFFLILLMCIKLVQGPAYEVFGVKQGNFAESIAIPLQQIGYTLSQGGKVTEEQKEFLNHLLPVETIAEVYRPNTPDHIKFHEAFNNEYLNTHKIEFLKVWAQMLPFNFVKYVKAWLMQTLGYYHIGSTNWMVWNEIAEEKYGVEATDYLKTYTKIDLHSFVEKIKGELVNIPIFGSVYHISVMVWFSIFVCGVLLIKKQYKYMITILPLLAVWGTMMIAVPTFCEFRYMFSFHLALPILIFLLYKRGRENYE